jgi:mannose-1-phosphate guanylyltransferase / mannose-6-phosphate isomerase
LNDCGKKPYSMTTPQIIPVILSGGSGSRLWPLSRNARPKQFLKFGGTKSLIEDTLERCQGPLFDASPILVGSFEHRFMLAEAAQSLGVIPKIVLEPMRRDSCAAIVAGALMALERDINAIILVVAADHYIPDHAAFAKAVADAMPAAKAGMLVSFGVQPVSAATGYGYILPGDSTPFGKVTHIARFVEKPDLQKATEYVTSGYLWNSGNFLFQARAVVDEAEKHMPAVVSAMAKALTHAERDSDFVRLDKTVFEASPQISFDYGVMEKTSQACVLPVDYCWSDIGSWDAVTDRVAKDEFQNAIVGRGLLLNAFNVSIHSEHLQTAVIGCKNIIVVATRDAVLVVERGQSEQVKTLVKDLEQSMPLSDKDHFE